MKRKLVTAVAVALCLSLPVWAKSNDKGVEMSMKNWGIITVPADLIMEEGTQPYLTARTYGNDVARMLENIYPAQPVCWQLVQKDDAQLQYGYLLRCSLDLWQAEAAVGGRQQENSYLRDIGSRPDIESLARHANNRLRTSLPANFELLQPFAAHKVKGKTFYESLIQRPLFFNQTHFTETIYTLAWQHGDQIEIAVLLGYRTKDQGLLGTASEKTKAGSLSPYSDLLSTAADMLKNAQKMPRK